ncbi:MAG TPA: 50S ribosomal protein L23 [Candidatus Woesearchaeota archaeon]|nr:50S ribosomal protein L23 [Candidatus Woesearchaeota archaeon]
MTLIKPINSEKYIKLLETENKIAFEVEFSASRTDVKSEVEKSFKVKVDGVRIMITPKGKKRAVVSISKDTPAFDIATKLGLV